MACVERLDADWRRRAEELDRLAAREGARAWLARIRLRILRYLIARYGGEAVLPRPGEGHGGITFLAPRCAAGRGTRSSGEMRRLLERIHDAVSGAE